jgi:hypothetical protein
MEAEGMATSMGNHIKDKLANLGSATAIEETVRRTIEWGEAVYDTAVKLKLTIEEEQRLDYALHKSGTSLQEQAKFFQFLSVARDKAMRGVGTPDQSSAFKAFGITPAQIADKRVSLFSIIAEKAQGMDQDKLITALRALGGRGAQGMIEAFRIGLKDLMAAAPVVPDNTIIQLKEAGDKIKTVFSEIRAAIAPTIGWLTTVVADAFHGLIMGAVGALGFVTNAVEQMARLPHALKTAVTTGKVEGGLGLGAAWKAATGAAEAYGKAVSDQEKKERAALERARNAPPLDLDLEGGGEGGGKGSAHSTIQKLKDALAKKQEENDLKTLSREGQILKLTKDRAAVIAEMHNASKKDQAETALARIKQDMLMLKDQKIWDPDNKGIDAQIKKLQTLRAEIQEQQSEEFLLKRATEVEEIDSKLRALTVSGSAVADKPDRHKPAQHQVLNQLQQTGQMFVRSPLETTVLDVQRKIEQHTKKMSDHLAKKHSAGAWDGSH